METDIANPGNRLPVETLNGSSDELARDQLILGFVESLVLDQPNGGLSVDDELLESGLIDSIGVVSLVGFVEDQFSIPIPAEDVIVENFSSVSALDEYLATRRSA